LDLAVKQVIQPNPIKSLFINNISPGFRRDCLQLLNPAEIYGLPWFRGFHFKSIGVNMHAHKKEPPPNPRISHTHTRLFMNTV
jgi:hypothetical protein